MRLNWLFPLVLVLAYLVLHFFIYLHDPAHPALWGEAAAAGAREAWFRWADQGQYLTECQAFRALDFDANKLFYPPAYSALHAVFGCGHLQFALVDATLGGITVLLIFALITRLTESRSFAFWSTLFALTLPNVWNQYPLPWSSNLSTPLTLAFVICAFSGAAFDRNGAALVALQYLTRPLDAVIMGAFYLLAFIMRHGSRSWSVAVRNRAHYFAVAVVLANAIYNFAVYGSVVSRYTTFSAGFGLDFANYFAKGATILFNPGVMYPSSTNFSLISLNWVLPLFLMVPFLVGATRVGIWALLPVVLYFTYSAYNGLQPKALLVFNMIHYFKSAYILSFVFLAAAARIWWNQDGSRSILRRRVLLYNTAWIAFLFLNLGMQKPAAIGVLSQYSAGDSPVLQLTVPTPGCRTQTCIVEVDGIYSPSPNSYAENLNFLSGPETLRPIIDYAGQEFDPLRGGLSITFHRSLPPGEYKFSLNKNLQSSPGAHGTVILEVQSTLQMWVDHLTSRWY